MSIEDFFTMCDQILRKAAQKNPEVLCLQNIPHDDKASDTNSQTEANRR